jgi:hypothetical protein
MPTQLAQHKKPAFDIANLLEDAADAIRERTKTAYSLGKMTPDEYLDARAKEATLRAKASLIVAKSIGAKLDSVKEAGGNIEDAIAQAKARIEEIQSVKRGLEIVASLIALAGAIATGNTAAILAASKDVLKASKKPKPK